MSNYKRNLDLQSKSILSLKEYNDSQSDQKEIENKKLIPMDIVLIGGIERKINMVKTYKKYNGNTNLPPKEIIENSRANRLYYKELQKLVQNKVNSFKNNDFIELPEIEKLDYDNRKYKSKNNYQAAIKMELDMAKFAADFQFN